MEQTTSTGQNSKLIAGSIVIAALLVGAALFYQPGARLAKAPPAEAINPIALSTDDDFILGNPDAPVTMIIFGDYQCPFCKKMFTETELKLRTEYVLTNKVKMVYRDFPLDSIHPFARKAAQAAQCAGSQGKYWAYHDELFKKQSEIPTLDFTNLAGSLGLEKTTFKTCLDSEQFAAEVEKDNQDGQALGIDGTPATFINGTRIPGAYPYATFKQVIEAALK